MRAQSSIASCALLAVIGATTATAQTNIYGLDLLGQQFFTTDTAAFVNNLTNIGINQEPVYALDFDAAATTIWGITFDGLQYGNFDLATGVFNYIGNTTGLPLGCNGLTAAPDGVTWYAVGHDSASNITHLYKGDATTGTFTYVGLCVTAGIIIDISVDSFGNLYGHSISSDSLYQINTNTGAVTWIGLTGYSANFAQGMDFDWTNDTLYAMLYGGTVSGFYSIDTTTGVATLLDDTTSLNLEAIITCESPAPGEPGVGFCFGDPGAGTPCPCGNDNDGSVPGSGCANGVNQAGAQLRGEGGSSVGNDTLILKTTGLEPSNAGLYFQADNDLSPGTIWGDGLRCAGGSLKRLGVRFSDGTGYSDTSGFAQSISAKAGNVVAGQTKYYQCWYRNIINSPCGNDFNQSNGYSILWTP